MEQAPVQRPSARTTSGTASPINHLQPGQARGRTTTGPVLRSPSKSPVKNRQFRNVAAHTLLQDLDILLAAEQDTNQVMRRAEEAVSRLKISCPKSMRSCSVDHGRHPATESLAPIGRNASPGIGTAANPAAPHRPKRSSEMVASRGRGSYDSPPDTGYVSDVTTSGSDSPDASQARATRDDGSAMTSSSRLKRLWKSTRRGSYDVTRLQPSASGGAERTGRRKTNGIVTGSSSSNSGSASAIGVGVSRSTCSSKEQCSQQQQLACNRGPPQASSGGEVPRSPRPRQRLPTSEDCYDSVFESDDVDCLPPASASRRGSPFICVNDLPVYVPAVHAAGRLKSVGTSPRRAVAKSPIHRQQQQQLQQHVMSPVRRNDEDSGTVALAACRVKDVTHNKATTLTVRFAPRRLLPDCDQESIVATTQHHHRHHHEQQQQHHQHGQQVPPISRQATSPSKVRVVIEPCFEHSNVASVANARKYSAATRTTPSAVEGHVTSRNIQRLSRTVYQVEAYDYEF